MADDKAAREIRRLWASLGYLDEWARDASLGMRRISNGQIPDGSGTMLSTLSPATAHNVLSSVHSDTLAGSVVAGDLLYGNSTPRWDRLPLGTLNQVLGANAGATAPEYKTVQGVASEIDVVHGVGTITIGLVDPLIATKGGSGFASYAVGDLLYADTTTTLDKRIIGSSAQLLQTVAGLPTWATISGDASVASGGVLTLATLSPTVPPGTFGSATKSVTITVSAKGLVTAASESTISGVAPAAHNFLDSAVHNNTTTGIPIRGDIITAQGVSPLWTKLAIGASTTVLHGGTEPSWSAVNLAADVGSSVLPIANGGTSAATAILAFNALAPTTTRGDLIVMGVVNDQRLAVGATAGQILRSDATDPVWSSTLWPNVGTSGGVLGFTSTTQVASSVLLTLNALVIGGGAGATPTPLALGTANQVLGIINAGGSHEYKTIVGTANEIDVALTVANTITIGLVDPVITTKGGTGLASYTAGDLPYYAAGTLLSKLPIGTSGLVLTSSGTAPQWSTVASVVDVARTWTTVQKFPDDKFLIVGSADASKMLAFEVDGFTTATTRTVTVPNTTGIMALGSFANLFTTTQDILPLTDVTALTLRGSNQISGSLISNLIEGYTVTALGPTKCFQVRNTGRVVMGANDANLNGLVRLDIQSTTTNAANTAQIVHGGNFTAWSSGSTGAQVYGDTTANGPAVVRLQINQGSGQSVDMFRVRNTAGTIDLVKVDSAGVFSLAGTTSGIVSLGLQAAAGTYNFNLPTDAGTAGQPLLSGGGGAAVQTYGTLGVAGGGTGVATFTTNGVLYGNGTGAVQVTVQGAAGTVLHGNAGAPTFTAVSLTADVGATILPIANGGTAADLSASLSNGGIVYSTAAAFAIMAGTVTSKQLLQSGPSSTPNWTTATWPSTVATGEILYGSATNQYTNLAKGTAAQLLIGQTGAPTWNSIGGDVTIGATGITTIGNGKVVLTTMVTGILPLANGGTNSSAAAVNGGVVYSTATLLAITAAGTEGQVLTSHGAAAPTFAAAAGGGKIVQRWTANGPYPASDTKVDGAFVCTTAFTISAVRIWRGTAGSSGTTTCDIFKNGTTIYTVAAKPAITSAQTSVLCAVPDTLAAVAGDIFTMDILATTVEAGTPANLIVEFEAA